MKHNYSHNNQHKDFFEKTEIPYSRSKQEVWASIVEQRKKTPKNKNNTRKLVIQWAVAASIAILLGVTGFMRFYTVTFYARTGEHITQTLPDNSKIHLNANTKASYKPYWWRINRKIEMEGEAYFEVTKGNSFTVTSNLGQTRVLGTSFNIFARGEKYNVHCLTGKVEVKSQTGIKKVLLPDQAAAIKPNGDVKITSNVNVKNAISWTNNEFVFTSAPLNMVFKEMERQFDIQIISNKKLSGTYTGNFKRGSSPEEILTIIAKPFGLKVKKIHQSKYQISRE